MSMVNAELAKGIYQVGAVTGRTAIFMATRRHVGLPITPTSSWMKKFA